MKKRWIALLTLVMVVAGLTACGGGTGVSDQMAPETKKDTVAVMETTMGTIRIKLFPKLAPKSVENFVGLAEKGYYNGTIFHRVINDFMIQGGDPKGNGTGGQSLWGKPFSDEFSDKLHNFRGALSMANSGPDTNGSQFFIVQAPVAKFNQTPGISGALKESYEKNGGTPWLDNHHSVFGQVVDTASLAVVDKIASAKKDARDKPAEDIKITGITIVKP